MDSLSRVGVNFQILPHQRPSLVNREDWALGGLRVGSLAASSGVGAASLAVNSRCYAVGHYLVVPLGGSIVLVRLGMVLSSP